MRRILLASLLITTATTPLAYAGGDDIGKALFLLEASRLAEAKPIVDANRDRPGVGPFLAGEYDFYRGAYADAARELEEATKGGLDPRLLSEANQTRDLARADDAVTHGFVTKRSAHFEIKVAPGKDEVLIAPALEALEKALAAIGGDLGVHPPDVIRVEIYGDVRDLAKVSPLTVAQIETSGTIALCKYNRLMATSPRALVAGYPWLDTISHELTHYLVNYGSGNTVPIWLHEGIAKSEERRWREPFGGPLQPQLEHLLASGLRDHHLVTFAQMYPSMALLPSQEDAGLAFAEVTTAVQYMTAHGGVGTLHRLLTSLHDGADLDHALTAVTGSNLKGFEKKWREWLAGRGYHTHPELGMERLHFRHDGDKAKKDEDEPEPTLAKSPSEQKARGHVRLGTMMRTRGRLGAAAVEYESAQTILGAGHPEIAGRLGRTYLELGQWDRAIAAAEPGIARQPDSAGLHATVGRAYLAKGDAAHAEKFLEGALAVNPYDPQTRCGLAHAYQALSDPRAAREAGSCEALGGER
jgi:hypothetical protein